MRSVAIPTIGNGECVPLAEVPEWPYATFREAVVAAIAAGDRLVSLFGRPEGAQLRLYAVLAAEGRLSVLTSRVDERYAALTPDAPQAHLAERELAEQWGVVPEGHPWLKPLRFHPSYVPGRDAWGRSPEAIGPARMAYYRVAGEAVHEVAVGPIHAGVIEPGHFRFQCVGERVLHLEIAHGFQHRGVERALEAGPNKRTPFLVETLAGDTSVGHGWAHAQAVEALAGVRAPVAAEYGRAIALELERLANHVGDLGALANDVGFLPTASYCGRLRGEFLNLTALVCGNRFGRGLVRPGGLGYGLTGEARARMGEVLPRALADLEGAVGLLWRSPSVMARFAGTGTLAREDALALGMVGPAARASGLARDVRREFPQGAYREVTVPTAMGRTGDVLARAQVRWEEVTHAIASLRKLLAACPEGEARAEVGPLAPSALAVSLVEGWRGEIAHVALTDARGRFAAYKVVDPSFHNWAGVALAVRGEAISDFPLCNKSFNLSYCGFDL